MAAMAIQEQKGLLKCLRETYKKTIANGHYLQTNLNNDNRVSSECCKTKMK